MQPRGRRQPSLGLMLLIAELYQASTRYGIPPVTLSAIIAQIVIYLQAVPLPWFSSQACLSTFKILHQRDYWKLLIAQVEHGDDWHLYYNMVSFMWKGKSLEIRMGSKKYALLLIMFTAATGLTYVGLNYALMELLEDTSYLHRCAVGFSGVIFALKVLTTHYGTENQRIGRFGIPVSSKYAVWFELVLISLITPNASFVGHLAGILVGLAYLYGPLKPLLNFVDDVVFHGGWNLNLNFFNSPRTPRFSSTSQSTGYSTRQQSQRPSTSYNDYSPPGMSEEEQIRRAREESLRDPPSYGWRDPPYNPSFSSPTAPPQPSATAPTQNQRYSTQPTPEELRRIRLQRYNN